MLHTHIAFLRKFYISGLASASFLAVFIMLAIFPVANSFSGVQAASVVSETSLVMTVPDIDLALSVDSATGTFRESEAADFSVTTNNYSGYTLSIRAANDDENYSKLVNGESVLNSISSASDESGFNNGNWGFKPSKLNSASNDDFLPAPTYEGTTIDTTAVANNEANTYDISIGAKANYGLAAGKYSNTFIITAIANPVAYSISYDANTLDQSVANMPTTQVGDTTDTSVTLANNVPTRTGYAFTSWCLGTITNSNGIDACTGTTYNPSDTYDTNQTQENVVVLKAMWNRVYTITFNANNGTGTMPGQSIVGNTATIDTNLYTRVGYNFDGWNTAAAGTGTSYTDGDTFTVPASGTSTTLYAQWDKIIVTFDQAFAAAGKTVDTTSNKYKMQDMNVSICDAVTDEQETELVDIRDGTVYRVGKLLDGHCWMQDNLALDLTANDASAKITTSNTNADEASLKALFGTAVRNATSDPNGNLATAGVASWTSSYSYSEPLINASSKTVVPTTYDGTDDPMKDEVVAGNWKVGVYYNFCAASAGSFCNGNGTNAYFGYGHAEYDICPSGWRLPTGFNSGEYRTLFSAYNADVNSFRSAFLAPFSGEFDDGLADRQGYFGSFWSSTNSSGSWAGGNAIQRFEIYGYTYKVTSTHRKYGSAVRCIARNSEDPGTFSYAFADAGKTKATANDGKRYYKMQDMNTRICNAVTTPTDTTNYSDTQETQLVDIRDGKTYWVSKLLDGHCWMTQNLDLDLETTPNRVAALNHENTDLGWGSDSATTSWTPENATATASNGTFIGWNDDYNNPYSADPGDWYWDNTWYNSNDCYNSDTDEVLCNYLDGNTLGKFSQSSSSFSNGTHGHVGNYYNWAAAIASNDASSYSSSTYSDISNNPQNSICPAGWRLPTISNASYATAGSTNEFMRLTTLYGNNISDDRDLIDDPLYFIRSGNVNSYSLKLSGEKGYYWSSTVGTEDGGYEFVHQSDYAGTDGYWNRKFGFSIRCIAR